jgi:hypothetical protein
VFSVVYENKNRKKTPEICLSGNTFELPGVLNRCHLVKFWLEMTRLENPNLPSQESQVELPIVWGRSRSLTSKSLRPSGLRCRVIHGGKRAILPEPRALRLSQHRPITCRDKLDVA